MKKIEMNQMEMIEGGSNRQCLIDGVLTFFGVEIGFAAGGFLGAGAALIAGLGAANANGCFEKAK